MPDLAMGEAALHAAFDTGNLPPHGILLSWLLVDLARETGVRDTPDPTLVAVKFIDSHHLTDLLHIHSRKGRSDIRLR